MSSLPTTKNASQDKADISDVAAMTKVSVIVTIILSQPFSFTSLSAAEMFLRLSRYSFFSLQANKINL